MQLPKFSRKTINISLMLAFPIITLFLASLADQSLAERDITERDYIIERTIQFQGSVAIVGKHYTISATDSKWPQQVTFVMNKDRSLMVRIYSIERPAGVLMLASQPSSPRLIKAVWAQDDLRYPVSFWTEDIWLRKGSCDHSGCPRIRFQATRGTIGVSILNKRR